MLALGYGIQRRNIVSRETFDGCSVLCFQVVLPILLFMDVSRTSLEEAFHPVLMATAVGGVAVVWLLAMLIVPRLEPEQSKRGVMVQGISRSNFILFGIPMARTMCGPEAAGAAAMVIAVLIPVYNILSVIALESFRGGKPNGKSILLGIVKNPLVDAAVLGLLYLASGLKMPALLEHSLDSVSAIATPLAILAIGGTFRFSALQGRKKQLAIVVLSKLFLVPALVVGVGILIGLRGLPLAILLGTCATPVAVSSFPMAQTMGGDAELAGQIVVFSVLCSMVSLFFWVLFLTNFGFV